MQTKEAPGLMCEGPQLKISQSPISFTAEIWYLAILPDQSLPPSFPLSRTPPRKLKLSFYVSRSADAQHKTGNLDGHNQFALTAKFLFVLSTLFKRWVGCRVISSLEASGVTSRWDLNYRHLCPVLPVRYTYVPLTVLNSFFTWNCPLLAQWSVAFSWDSLVTSHWGGVCVSGWDSSHVSLLFSLQKCQEM